MLNPLMGLQEFFWQSMALSSITLFLMAYCWGEMKFELTFKQVGLGILLAAVLWGIFWTGDKLSSLMFDFADSQVDSIYSMGEKMPKWAITIQLLVLTGPAEELFWRGYVQKQLSTIFKPFVGFLITLGVYTLIHVWSLNFMLVMAAMVAGAVWGFLYYLKPSWLPALIISHALWDATVFSIFPY